MADPPAAITLPSGFWLDGRHHRQVQLRPMSAMDEVIALDTEAKLSPARRVTALLARHVDSLDGSTLEPLEVARSLTAGDREALLLHLRREMLGNELDCLTRCPSPQCGRPISLQLRVSDLLVPPYEAPHPSYELDVRHHSVAYRVRFRLPTGGDLEAAATIAVGDPDAAAEELLRSCVQAVDPAPDPDDSQALMSALGSDLSNAVVERDPQAELQLELQCPACACAFSTVFDTAAYLLEELDQEGATTQREVEALAYHYHWTERDLLGMGKARRQKYLDLLAQRIAAAP